MLDAASEIFKKSLHGWMSARTGCGFRGLKTIHGNVNSHELWPISNKCRFTHHLYNPCFTLHDDHGGWDGLDRRQAAARLRAVAGLGFGVGIGKMKRIDP